MPTLYSYPDLFGVAALRDFRGGSPQVDLTNSLTRHWEDIADATGVAYHSTRQAICG
ncbi:hypothetical protein OKW34_005183 [Paraburkholderia youngii]